MRRRPRVLVKILVAGYVARQLRAGLLFLVGLDHPLLDHLAAGGVDGMGDVGIELRPAVFVLGGRLLPQPRAALVAVAGPKVVLAAALRAMGGELAAGHGHERRRVAPSMIFRSRMTKQSSNVIEQKACSRSPASSMSFTRTSVISTGHLRNRPDAAGTNSARCHGQDCFTSNRKQLNYSLTQLLHGHHKTQFVGHATAARPAAPAARCGTARNRPFRCRSCRGPGSPRRP